MSTTSLLSGFVVVGLLTVTACSGSTTTTGTSGSSGSSGTSGSSASNSESGLGGSVKAKTCKNVSYNHPSTATDEACDACDAKECSAEAADVLGTDPNAFGGACADFVSCSCECEKTDTACLTKCPAVSKACSDALAAAQSCQKAKCATECAKDGG